MKLNTNQRKAVFELTGNTLITASPGSGKTKTLVARASNKLDSLPKNKSIALITYTNAGVDEIVSRLNAETGLFIGTIHSFCLEYILRPFGWIYKWSIPTVISYEQQKVFFEENEDIILDEHFGQSKFDELGKIKNGLDGKLDTSIAWNHSIELNIVAEKYYAFQEKFKVIDFNEILYRSYKIIIENEFVAKSLASKFHEILVDEFQDTNLFQYEILKAINKHGHCSFFMVGDEKQQIFSFAGAIDNSFDNAKIDFEANHLDLTETFRSTNKIVNAYSKLFSNHPIIENKSGCRDLEIDIMFFETTKANHDQLLESIVEQLITQQDIKESEIAILSTSWFGAFPVSKVLRNKYNVVGAGALPHRSISNSTISLLKSLSKYYSIPNIRNLRKIKFNIDLHLLECGKNYSKKDLNKKTNVLISFFLNLKTTDSLKKGLLKLKQCFDEIFEFSHSSFDEIIELIDEKEIVLWNILQYIKALAGIDGITSNTIHKVKGMEFEVVILHEMNENKIPYQKCTCNKKWTYEPLSEAGIEDGRKLFYVAVSRAKKILIVLHNWKPSMFINMIK